MALGASTAGGTLTAQTLSSDLSLTGNLTAGGAGDAIVLAAAANLLNPFNKTLTTGAGRWVVYSTDPTLNTFGGLASGNQALWNRSYPAAVPETGNRYVFSTQPTLQVTSTNVAKNYGVDATPTVAAAYTITGFVNAATFGNVFTQDTTANAITGSPTVTSLGSAALANVSGSPYAITVDAMAFVTVFWALSGLLMWWQIKATRKLGVVLVLFSLIAAGFFAFNMHAMMTS